jgi:hypothetical protein
MTRPEFTKQNLFEDAVPEFDDYGDSNNGLNYLYLIKSKFPSFKCTLFAVPFWERRNQRRFLELSKTDWIQFGIHGEVHPHPREMQNWTEEKVNNLLDEIEEWNIYEKLWRSPGWQISDATYKVLNERGYICADQHYNKHRRPEGLKTYCTCHPWMVHGHIQDINNDNPIYRNGLRQFIEEHGLPFNQDTNFHFVTGIDFFCK